MYKSGLLPAPVIQPMKYDSIGSKLKVGPNTYIQIKTGKILSKMFFLIKIGKSKQI